MKHSKGTWKVGRLGTVVTDNGEGFPVKRGYDDTGYYGGYLIAESIYKEADAKLMAEAGNVANETGCTPRQLTEQKAELLEALKRFTERKVESLDEIDCYIFHISDIKKAELAIKKATQ